MPTVKLYVWRLVAAHWQRAPLNWQLFATVAVMREAVSCFLAAEELLMG